MKGRIEQMESVDEITKEHIDFLLGEKYFGNNLGNDHQEEIEDLRLQLYESLNYQSDDDNPEGDSQEGSEQDSEDLEID